ncbi:hypothetical protein ACPB8Q_00370 [Methanocaldococcus indicus]|uniref:hypothetical protein n=1 Tax=Methanocaldococcus indicus TaxID=213231 RepID=UPI003C6CFAF4
MDVDSIIKKLNDRDKLFYYQKCRKNIGIALILSFIVPGFGLWYLEKILSGSIYTIIWLFTIILLVLMIFSIIGIIFIPFWIVIYLGLCIVCLIHTYISGKRYNKTLLIRIFGGGE